MFGLFSEKSSRGQVATENIMIIGVMLVIISALAGYSFFMYNDSVGNAQVQDSLKELRTAVNNVYALGEGNAIVVEITLPNSVTSTQVGGADAEKKAIFITANNFGSETRDFVEVDTNVSGEISGTPPQAGIYDIIVRNVNGEVTLNVV